MPQLSNLPPGVTNKDIEDQQGDDFYHCPNCTGVEIIGLEYGTYKRDVVQTIPHQKTATDEEEKLPEIMVVSGEIMNTNITEIYLTCQVCGHQWEG